MSKKKKVILIILALLIVVGIGVILFLYKGQITETVTKKKDKAISKLTLYEVVTASKRDLI